jgi:hypothetical protein
VIKKYIIAWFGLPFVGIFNGTTRNLTYQKIVGEQPAHRISPLSAIVLIALYVWLISRRWKSRSAGALEHKEQP